MATEREQRLANTVTNQAIEVTTQPILAPVQVVAVQPSGALKPYFSGSHELNSRDYVDTAENSLLLVASTALAAGIETTADTLQYSLSGMDGGTPNILLAGIQLLAFSILKLLALWLRSSGASLFGMFMSFFRRRRR